MIESRIYKLQRGVDALNVNVYSRGAKSVFPGLFPDLRNEWRNLTRKYWESPEQRELVKIGDKLDKIWCHNGITVLQLRAGEINESLHKNGWTTHLIDCLLYTSPSPRDRTRSRMPSSA